MSNYIKNELYGCDWAITVTLKPKCFKLCAEKQYESTKDFLVRRLNDIGSTSTVVMELTKNFNVHYHAVLCVRKDTVKNKNIKNIPKYICDSFRNSDMFGFVNIKQCTDVSKWILYMLKDIQNTYTTMGVYPVPVNGYKLKIPLLMFNEGVGANEVTVARCAESDGDERGTSLQKDCSSEKLEPSI